MKVYTDIEQSKKLAEILPLKSADMYWWHTSIRYYVEAMYVGDFYEEKGHIRAWSIAALLGILPEGTRLLKSANILSVGDTKYHCDCPKANIDKWFDNPVDACVAMIEKLHELNLL